MAEVDMSGLLAQMRIMRAQLGMESTRVPVAESLDAPDFASLLKLSIDKVNAAQQSATSLKDSFEAGESGLDLASVMVESQKAGLAFRATVEVRNHLVSAYQEIMRMPV